MLGSLSPKRVIWAVDAFENNQRLYKNAARLLESLVEKTGASIKPVYILNTGELNFSAEMSSTRAEDYRPAALKALKRMFEQISAPKTLEPHIILQQIASSTEAVELLVRYSEWVEADLILVSTHGKTGVRRILEGSFAETLIVHSKIPVMVVGPNIWKLQPLERMLFPTEFGYHSEVLFRKMIELAKIMKFKLTLFHAVPHPIEPLFQSGVYLLGGTWMPVHSLFGKEVFRQTRRAKSWASWANKLGVVTDYVVHSRGGSIAEAIVSLAKKKRVGMILMESLSGPISAALIGSITRQVIRSANCPVWVIPVAKAEEKPLTSEQKVA